MVEGALKRSVHVNSCVSRKRRCMPKTVRFSSSYTERTVENYLGGLEKTEEEILRSQLWYNTRDFERFMRERVDTIRFLRAVQGNFSLIEPMYCLRGFEFFTCTTGEVARLRTQHVKTVLFEQQQGSSSEQIVQAAVPKSVYALNRARQFAAHDAMEARAHQHGQQQQQFACSTNQSAQFFKPAVPLSSNSSLRDMMMPKSFSATAVSRQSLVQFSLLPQRRISVDVSKLQEMNLKFLQGLGAPGASSSSNPARSNTNTTLDLLNEALKATSNE
eukprot:CAMPEP_0198148058 /NCGR_PEP_ID=MMETSP1443-20131203/39526_1 /TAXON_ID=186043 /ORGANISM="Entomoneis sp., Strain CCMP2396" /LENGTH=273 /DNA_ID=CAMNT_0043812629 /DNA_START=29 /DNA_END=850 /DNA_ORIENTATION=-